MVNEKLILADIQDFVLQSMNEIKSSRIVFRKAVFYSRFLANYPLRYQYNDKIYLTCDQLVNIITKKHIDSKYKRKIKRRKKIYFKRGGFHA